MAYNYFPTSYQPVQQVYQNPFQQQYQQQYNQQAQQQSSGLIWVQGEAAAKSYPVAPGTSVLLMDSENSVFFIKSSDASGMPLPLRIFDYTERVQQPQNHSPVAQPEQQINLGNYVTREELEERLSQIMQSQSAPETSTTPAVVKREPAKKERTNG